MQQQPARLNLEAIILKSFHNNTLKSTELESLHLIAREFSKSGTKAYQILMDLQEKNIYDEGYFCNKIAAIGDKEFLKVFLEASKVANLAPLLQEYEHCIKLDKQEALANFIYKETMNNRVIPLDSSILKGYEYESKTDCYQTFAQAEQNLREDDPRVLYATGIEFLDTAFDGGLATGQLILVSGDYEAGKTTLTTQILENMSAAHRVCFFCFEFTLSAYIRRRSEQPNALFNKNNLYTITDGYDIREIRDNIITLNRQKGIQVFLIDSQMRIENRNTTAGNGEEKESEKFEILGKLAHEKELIIILIVQTSKSDPDTPFKSKKGAHEASIIMHLENIENKDELHQQYAQKRLKVKKNKQTGKHFKEDIFLDLESGMFVKDPNHEYKDTSYDSKSAVLNIDLDCIPIF